MFPIPANLFQALRSFPKPPLIFCSSKSTNKLLLKLKNFLIPLYLLLENSLFYNERGHFMHTSRKNLFLYLPILILFLASFIWVLKAPDHFSWSADLYLRNDDTSVLSQLFTATMANFRRTTVWTEPGTATSSPFPVCPICVVLPYFGLTRRIPRNPIASHTSAFF